MFEGGDQLPPPKTPARPGDTELPQPKNPARPGDGDLDGDLVGFGLGDRGGRFHP